MKKELLVLFLFGIVLINACNPTEDLLSQKSPPECKSFYDCIPTNVHPGETGCGGCYPDNGNERCYELNKNLCSEYQTNYSCTNDKCIIPK